MCKQKLFVRIILFFLVLCYFVPAGHVVFAQNFTPKFYLKIICDENVLNFTLELNSESQRSEIFNEEIGKLGVVNLLKKLDDFGISDKQKVFYLFPQIKQVEEKTKNTLEEKGERSNVYVIKNTCKIQTENGKPATFLNEEKFYSDILSQLEDGKKNIVIHAKTVTEKRQNLKNKFVLKGSFETNFATSSAERKNNIAVALERFDGLILEPGETFSFNEITGKRNAESGYDQAKIISGGTFVSGYGGGVCQVSTTIYNACLLAGLEIVEVHPHSLPVSYVEPGFDAMVNFASSDLVVRNSTEGAIIFATSNKNDKCRVKIYGPQNKFTIVRTSNKTKTIPKGEEVVDCDYFKYENLNLEIGEEKRLSYAKDGFSTESFLCFYDSKGNLVKKTKIRQNTYSPTVGLTVVRKS